MHEPPADALRKKKDSSMRVAINLVKDEVAAGLRVGRQHRCADGDLALRAEDAARHRPPGDRGAAADARRRRDGAGPRRQRQLLARAARAVRGDGNGARVGDVRHRAAVGRPAQRRRGGNQGQRAREAHRGTPARVGPQFLRQCRRQRHLQGNDRSLRVRRLRRQRGAEGVRGPRDDALRDAEGRIHPQRVHAARRARSRIPCCAPSSAGSIRACSTARRSSA